MRSNRVLLSGQTAHTGIKLRPSECKSGAKQTSLSYLLRQMCLKDSFFKYVLFNDTIHCALVINREQTVFIWKCNERLASRHVDMLKRKAVGVWCVMCVCVCVCGQGRRSLVELQYNQTAGSRHCEVHSRQRPTTSGTVHIFGNDSNISKLHT
jgi:hypothetical protein